MFLESKEGALVAVLPANAVAAAPAAGVRCPTGRWAVGARESCQIYISGERCQQLEAETRQIPAGNKGQAFRHEFNEQLGELPRVREGSCVAWKMAWFSHGLSGPTVMPG